MVAQRTGRRPAARSRVVNDLVQLKSKDTLALFDEFGPIRYNAPQRVGFTTRAELINGRIAMVAITAASARPFDLATAAVHTAAALGDAPPFQRTPTIDAVLVRTSTA